jgi:hypothetical protein
VGSWKEISSSLCGFLPTLLFWGVKFGTNAKKKRLHIPFFWGKKIIPKKKIPPLFDSDFENRRFFKYSKTFFIYITQKIIFFEKNNF